jgi:hypothetical protein
MLPNPKDQPASLRETPIRILVPLVIGFDFAAPELPICFWPSTVHWAAVPETSINEDGNAGRNKCQVGATT